MPFEVKLTNTARDQLSHLPRDTQQRIAHNIKTLEDFPFPRGNTIRRIQGTNKPIYRLRVGNYRVVYQLDVAERQVIVLTVVHRQRLERALNTLFTLL